MPIQVKLKVISYQLCSIFVMFIPSRSPSWSSLYHTVKNRYLSHILAPGNCSLTFQKIKTRFVSYNKESDLCCYSITFCTANSSATVFTCVLNHGSHCHPSAASLVIAGGRIVSATATRARVEDTLGVDAGSWDVRYGDRTYPDVCSLSRQRWVFLASRKSRGNQNKMSTHTGAKLMVTHKWIPHHMPSKAGTFSH